MPKRTPGRQTPPTKRAATPVYNQQRALARNQTTVAQAQANVARSPLAALRYAGNQARPWLRQAIQNPVGTAQSALRNPYVQAGLGTLAAGLANPTPSGIVTTALRLGRLGTTGVMRSQMQRAALSASPDPTMANVRKYGEPAKIMPVYKGGGNAPSKHGTWGEEIWPEGYTGAPGTPQEGGYGLGGYGDYGSLGGYENTPYSGYTGAANNYNRAPGYAANMETNPYWRRALATWRF